MRESHQPHDELDGKTPAEQAAAGAPNLDSAEAAVPVRSAPEPVHRWLDGEQVPAADLGAPESTKHVKFWAKVNTETDRRRRMLTPSGLDAVIMGKLDAPVVKDD